MTEADPRVKHLRYDCTRCGTTHDRADLRVKRVIFQDIGKNAKTWRSRNVAWLCPACLEDDVDYNAEAFTSPGYRGTSRVPDEA